MIGWRPIMNDWSLDLVAAGACADHLIGIRDYLSEFEPAVCVAPEVYKETGNRMRREAGREYARFALLSNAG